MFNKFRDKVDKDKKGESSGSATEGEKVLQTKKEKKEDGGGLKKKFFSVFANNEADPAVIANTIAKADEKKERDIKKATKSEDLKSPTDKDKDKEKDEKKEEKRDKKEEKKKSKKKIQNALNKAPNAYDEVLKWSNKTLDKGIKELRNDFNNLKTWSPEKPEAVAFSAAENQTKNRYKDIPCLDVSRVKLKNDNYIHANYVNTPYGTKRFICTQGPMDNTCEAFWQMILDEECEAILMVCNITECNQKKCSEYYPPKAGQLCTFGDYTIKAIKQYLQPDDQSIEITTLNIKGPNGLKHFVKHFHWLNWPDKGVPEINLTPTNMLSSVRGSKKPIVVHCSAGIGRTGTVVLIEYILEKMLSGQHSEDTIDILKELRRQRAGSVQTDMQYVFVHRFLLHYFIERKSIEMSQRYLEFVDDYDAMLRKFVADEEERRKKKVEALAVGAPSSASPAVPSAGADANNDPGGAPTNNFSAPNQSQQEAIDPFFSIPEKEVTPTKIVGVTALGAASDKDPPTVQPTQMGQIPK